MDDYEWEPCTLRDDDWELDHGLSRLEYLRLLRLGYIRNQNSSAMPLDLWEELAGLEEVEAVRVAEEAEAAIRKKAIEWEELTAPEAELAQHWHQQRQLGKSAAAEAWAKKFGQELPVIIEIAETEEEMREAIRKLKNVAQAKKSQGLGRRKGK